jgi:hypothetical protein
LNNSLHSLISQLQKYDKTGLNCSINKTIPGGYDE